MDEQEKDILDRAWKFLKITDLNLQLKRELSGVRDNAFYHYTKIASKEVLEHRFMRSKVTYEACVKFSQAYNVVSHLYGIDVIEKHIATDEEQIKEIVENY